MIIFEPFPPKERPRDKKRAFCKLDFKMQSFIYFKYKENRPKKEIKKYLFIRTDYTYYNLDKKAKKVIKSLFSDLLTTSKLKS